jgi:serine phosphatase RsbU (regulator of sigma subunit)
VRRQLIGAVIGVATAFGIALVFDHPVERLVLPATLVFVTVVVISLYAGFVAGAITALAAAASVWYFNLPPGETFDIDAPRDAVSVVVILLVALVLSLVLALLREHDRSTAHANALLQLRIEEERSQMAIVQHALLPPRTPQVDGAEVVWRYAAPAPDQFVGGDWCAFVPIGPRQLGIAIGDVAGQGLSAVRAMADYRYTLRALAADDHDPASVLARTEATLRIYAQDVLCSAAYGVLDTARATWNYAVAGHVPPLVVHAHGGFDVLDRSRGRIFGTGLDDPRFQTESVKLAADDVLVLYTDGLVERRGEDLDVGVRRLAERVGETHARPLEGAIDSIVRDLVGEAPMDDVAIVMIRLSEASG